jgi:hypothetical protein
MKDGTFATIVLPDMPVHLRENLMSVLKLTFPDFIKPVESKGQGEKFSYPSLHFSWYNKYCFQVSKFLKACSLLTQWVRDAKLNQMKNLLPMNIGNRLPLARLNV